MDFIKQFMNNKDTNQAEVQKILSQSPPQMKEEETAQAPLPEMSETPPLDEPPSSDNTSFPNSAPALDEELPLPEQESGGSITDSLENEFLDSDSALMDEMPFLQTQEPRTNVETNMSGEPRTDANTDMNEEPYKLSE